MTLEEYIKKLEKELNEVDVKVTSLEIFLKKEQNFPKLTNEGERMMIAIQLFNLQSYYTVLENILQNKKLEKIELDKVIKKSE